MHNGYNESKRKLTTKNNLSATGYKRPIIPFWRIINVTFLQQPREHNKKKKKNCAFNRLKFIDSFNDSKQYNKQYKILRTGFTGQQLVALTAFVTFKVNGGL